MSHVTTTDGLQPNPVTVKAMITMPTPTEKQAVRRFLRDINYLAKFCSELSSVTQLQYNLTKEDMPFLWSTRHQQAFDSAKALATSTALQLYYCVQKRFSLEFSRQSIQNLMSRRSRQPIHVGHLPSVSRSSCSLGPHPTGPHQYHSRATTQCRIIMP